MWKDTEHNVYVFGEGHRGTEGKQHGGTRRTEARARRRATTGGRAVRPCVWAENEAFAMARENLDTQFFFKFDNGFGDARLRGIQPFSGGGDVKVMIDHLDDIAKLL